MVIALYNHERFIKRTIESVFRQTLKPYEIIVVDDGSTDRSVAVLQELCAAHPEIIFWSHPNQGAHYTLSAAIYRATGEFIAILNSDDLYDPDRLAACVALMRDHPDTSAVVTRVLFVDEVDASLANPWYERGLEFFTHVGDLSLALANANIIVSTSNLFLRRSVFSRIGLFAPLRYTHDLDFCLRLLVYGEKVAFLDRPLLSYRIHGNNTIAGNRQQVAVERAAVLAFFLYRRWRARGDPQSWAAYLARFAEILEAQMLDEISLVFVALALGRATNGTDRQLLGAEDEFRHFLDRSGVDWRIEDPGKPLVDALRSALQRQRNRASSKQQAWITELETANGWLKEQVQRLEETLSQQEASIREQLAENQKLDEAMAWLREHSRQLEETLADRDTVIAENSTWIGELVEARDWLTAECRHLEQALAEREAALAERNDWIASIETGKTWLEEERERLQRAVSDCETLTQEQNAALAKLAEAQEWLAGQNQRLERALAEQEGLISERGGWIKSLEEAKEWLAGQNQRLESALAEQTDQNRSLQNLYAAKRRDTCLDRFTHLKYLAILLRRRKR